MAVRAVPRLEVAAGVEDRVVRDAGRLDGRDRVVPADRVELGVFATVAEGDVRAAGEVRRLVEQRVVLRPVADGVRVRGDAAALDACFDLLPHVLLGDRGRGEG